MPEEEPSQKPMDEQQEQPQSPSASEPNVEEQMPLSQHETSTDYVVTELSAEEASK